MASRGRPGTQAGRPGTSTASRLLVGLPARPNTSASVKGNEILHLPNQVGSQTLATILDLADTVPILSITDTTLCVCACVCVCVYCVCVRVRVRARVLLRALASVRCGAHG